MYYSNVLDLIGDTPLMSLQESTGYHIFAKESGMFRII